MKEPISICVAQSDIKWEDKHYNFDKYAHLLSHINDNTDLIILPEMFSTGFSMNVESLGESMGGETMEWMKILARDKHSVVLSSFIVKEKERYFNRSVCVYPDGEYTYYDKRHLFSMGAEDKYFTEGDRRVIVDVNGWKIRLVVCYDIRFPVWCRSQNDYDLLICIANWPSVRRMAWETLLQARAIENQAYVVGVNRIGKGGMGLNYTGSSMIADYMGGVMEHLGDLERVETVDLFYKPLQRFKERFPAYKDADKFKLL